MTERPSLLAEAVSRASSVKVRNVMNPLLWLNAVVVPPCILATLLLNDSLLLAMPFVACAFIVPVWTLCSFSYFSVKDPQRLQSEEFIIEQQRLLLRSKGSSEIIDASAVPVGSNPELPQLSHGQDDE